MTPAPVWEQRVPTGPALDRLRRTQTFPGPSQVLLGWPLALRPKEAERVKLGPVQGFGVARDYLGTLPRGLHRPLVTPGVPRNPRGL